MKKIVQKIIATPRGVIVSTIAVVEKNFMSAHMHARVYIHSGGIKTNEWQYLINGSVGHIWPVIKCDLLDSTSIDNSVISSLLGVSHH